MAEPRWDMTFRALDGIPLIKQGDDLASIIYDAATASGLTLQDDDVLVVAQKIVSKAEGRVVNLADVTPADPAKRLAEHTGRDPRLCQLYLDESRAVLEVKGRHVVTLHKLGLVGTGAGIDRSNVAKRDDGLVVLLPADPDASARRIRQGIGSLTGRRVAVIVSDSLGSPSREGAIGAAIGLAGIRHLEEPSEQDLFGNPSAPLIDRVDEIASAASILMGQSAAARPVVVGRGITYTVDEEASIRRLLLDVPILETDYDLAHFQ